ncbi:MAG: glycosyltransferase family 2 protein [Gammaproteobacteria bacterium]|nr:glycosyltransferase family 2 protein [Gammaproteobacteria bacterium]
MLSIIIPAKNEAKSLKHLLPDLTTKYPEAEIIVVNDGSTDNTLDICRENDVTVISHPYSKGNGAAIKTGANAASGKTLVFMDADGQHKPEEIDKLLEKYNSGFHMVVGARVFKSQASIGRWLANRLYNYLSSWMVGQKIHDLTSGFRVANAEKFKKFIFLLPNGFSYPTTITMSFFRAGYSVGYTPVEVKKRQGKSHIKLFKDGARFFLIIFRVGTLYSPLKLFFPISISFFLLGCGYYLYTYISLHRFTNMSALLLITAVLIFLIGLVSEQITTLVYQSANYNDPMDNHKDD